MYRCPPPRSAPTSRDGGGSVRRAALALLTAALLTTTACVGGPAADRAASLGTPPPADPATSPPADPTVPDPTSGTTPTPSPTDASPTATRCTERGAESDLVEVAVQGTHRIDDSAALALLPDGDALVGSRTGALHRIDPSGGPEHSVPVGALPNVHVEDGGGLLGLEADEGFVYAYYTASSSAQIGRFSYGDSGNLGGFSSMLRNLPVTDGSSGGHLAFGPDRMFYAGIGADAGTAADELAGRLIRMPPSGLGLDAGSVTQDSVLPVPGSASVRGFAWDNCERIWVINADGGLSTLGTSGEDSRQETLLDGWDDDLAPIGLAYLDGALWISDASAGRLWRVRLDGERVADEEPQEIPVTGEGPLRGLRAGSDGRLYALDDSGLVVLSIG